jgi:hypothetical protein
MLGMLKTNHCSTPIMVPLPPARLSRPIASGLGSTAVSTDPTTWIGFNVADAFHHADVPVMANRRGANPPDLGDAVRFLGRGAGGFRLLGENLADLSVRVRRVSNIASDAGLRAQMMATILTSQTSRR